MLYPDGQRICVGDLVAVDAKYHGAVVGCVDDREYASPHTHEQWGHLESGILVDTKFGGIVHYPDEAFLKAEGFLLLARAT
jgi:hypothetical protein